jgi:hypothetical protein
MIEAQTKGAQILEASAHLYGFQCAGCLGKGIIIHGRQARVRVNHSPHGCPIKNDMQTRHPMLYARDMGYGTHTPEIQFEKKDIVEM